MVSKHFHDLNFCLECREILGLILPLPKRKDFLILFSSAPHLKAFKIHENNWVQASKCTTANCASREINVKRASTL